MKVLVTGANGQVGQALRFVAPNCPKITFLFCGSADLDIVNEESIKRVFNAFKPDFCINAAAYTAVDKAESEREKAYAVNVTGVMNLTEVCRKFNTTLLHISTDFVFDGRHEFPYTEADDTNPQGVYGQTKRDGELEISKRCSKYFIIRTSWVYSQFGNNFMKTMLRLAENRTSLSVVDDQTGTPTHAVDLAEVIIKIVSSNSENYGIYNFSNEGTASWFDFAAKIFEINQVSITLNPILTSQFPTPAKRPKYSVLDKSKIKAEFKVSIDTWENALKNHTLR